MHSVREVIAGPSLGLGHPQWAEAYPWLWQGCTTRRSGADAYDFGLFSGGSDVALVQKNWDTLLEATGAASITHARQVHGAEVLAHEGAYRGVRMVSDCDGHVTGAPSSAGWLRTSTGWMWR